MNPRSIALTCLATALILGSAACKRGGDGDTESDSAEVQATAGSTGLTVKPDRTGGLAVKGGFGPGDYLLEDNLRVTIVVSGKPGTHVTVQSTSFDLTSSPVRVSVDLWTAYAAMPAGSGTVDVKVIASEPGKPAHFEVVSFTTRSEWSGFTELYSGRRPLPTDAKATHKDDVLVALRLDHPPSPLTMSHEMKLYGTANARVLDVDRVAVVSEVVDREEPCGTFSNKAGKTMQVSRRALTTKVRLLDRHKKTAVEKSFTGTMPPCPAKLLDPNATSLAVDGRVDAAVIEGHLATLVSPGGLETMAVPAGESKLVTTGGAPQATADAPGFPSMATLKARVKKAGYEITKADEPTTDTPHETTLQLTKETTGCSMTPWVRFWDFDAFNPPQAHASHVDDKRAAWATGSKRLVDKLGPALAAVAADPKAFPGFLKSKGLPPSSAPMDSEYESTRGLSIVLVNGNDAVTAHMLPIAALAKVKGLALRRNGNRVLLAECSYDDTGVAGKMLEALVR